VPDRWQEGLPMLVYHLSEMIGRLHLLEGQTEEARHLFTVSLGSLFEMGRNVCTAHAIEGFARLALATGRADRAARLLGAADALLERLGMTMMPIERALFDGTVRETRDRLGEERYASAWEEGHRMSQQHAVAYALGDSI
jgi:hypothetical protein